MKFVPLLLILMCCPIGLTEPPDAGREVSVRRRCMDVIVLNDGTRLLGILLPSDPPSAADRTPQIKLLVRTAWLSESAEQLLDRTDLVSATGDAPPVTLQSLLTEHLTALQQDPDASPERTGYLQQRLNQLQAADNTSQTPTELTVLQIPADLIRRQLIQPDPVRQAGFLALLNQLPDVESLSQVQVLQQLQQIPQDELRRQLPATPEQQAQNQFRQLQFAADSLFGKTCRLIRVNDRFIDEDATAADQLPARAMTLLAEQGRSELQQLLQEALTGPGPAAAPAGGSSAPADADISQVPAAAAEIADHQQAHVLQITDLSMQLADGRVTVQVRRFYQDDDTGQWLPADLVTETATTADASADAKQQLADHPELESVLSLFQGLGASSRDIQQAVSMGAAVRIAVQRATTALHQNVHSAGNPSPTRPAVVIRRLTSLPATAEPAAGDPR